MPNEPHPRRAALGTALDRAYPVPPEDKQARDEKHLLRRLALRKAVRA